jgi:anti-anti-sigma factor
MADTREPNGDTVVVSWRRAGDRAAVDIAGELDLAGTNRVRAVAAEVAQSGVTLVEVDAGAVTFLDSAGLQSLLIARKELGAAGIGFRVCTMSPAVERVVDVASVREILVGGPPRPEDPGDMPENNPPAP